MTWVRLWVAVAVLGSGCGGDDGPGAARDTGPGGFDTGPGVDVGPDAECASDGECDDGTHCNGIEACASGRCVSGDPPDCDDGVVCTADSCSEETASCRHVAPDNDGDGHGDTACVDAGGAPIGDDCDDTDALAYPGNTEVCDGHDEDCNPDTVGFLDADGDGSASNACCNGTNCGGDCNDADNTVRPGVADGPVMACDSVDNDCDGSADEGCVCSEGTSVPCGTPPELMMIGTCRPGMQFCIAGMMGTCTGSVPPAEEICDTLDNDCDATVDEGVTRLYYVDADDDGFGTPDTPTTPATRACSVPVGYAPNADDCDDTRAGVSPSGTETCDGRDNDCDGMTDEGLLRTFYRDVDGDSFGTMTMSMTACSAPIGYVTSNTDCDDTRAAVNPAAAELCNGRDDDCDGTMDTGCACTDGMTRMCGATDVGECAFGTQRCVSGAWAECVGAVMATVETCNTLDDDCDGMADEMVRNTYYRDTDGDGFGAAAMTMMACTAPGGYVPLGTDCSDSDASRNPAAFERCDTVDNDCDGTTDEGCTCTDGATRPCGTSSTGVCRMGTQQCVGGMWGTCAGNIEPGTETCNGLDDDCDSMTDEMTSVVCYADTDSDGYGAGAVVQRCPDPARTMFGMCPVGFSNVSTDCNDASAGIRPGATETCNGIDDNCAGGTDEGLTVTGCYVDADADTYGAGPATTQCRDAMRAAAGFCPVGYYNRAMDCNDTRALTNPGATEDCNGLDDDCDAMIDDGVLNTYYQDADRDGYGVSTSTRMACSAPSGFVAVSGDCADADPTRYPGAPELCDGIDQNCTMMTTDEPRRTFYRDMDGDLYGTSTMTMTACTPMSGYVEISGDCNDANATVRPGAAEICNGTDDDCDGSADESAASACPGQNPFAINVASWACTAGACVPTCTATYGNCDALAINGCETGLSGNVDHCNMCGNDCGEGGTCAASCDRVEDIVAGGHTNCARRSNGRIVCWGDGDQGEIGDGMLNDARSPRVVPDIYGISGGGMYPPVIDIAHSFGNTTSQAQVFAEGTTDRITYGWGYNTSGEIGDGTMISPRGRPVFVTGFPTLWSRIAGGSTHTCAIRAIAPSGSSVGVVCWGANSENQLADCGGSGSSSPGTGIVTGSSTATDVSSGRYHSCYMLASGTVRCWGNMGDGKLGNGVNDPTMNTCTPVTLTFPGGFTPAAIETGHEHSCAVSTTGAAACWGDGPSGEIGNGVFSDRTTPGLVSGGLVWSQLSLGDAHTCGITTAGRLYCWGDNASGKLGLGTTTGMFATPQAIGTATNWIDVAAGTNHTCALNSAYDVLCWGLNSNGQLGDGTTVTRSVPTLVATL